MTSEARELRDEFGRVVHSTVRPLSLAFGLFIGYNAVEGLFLLEGRERLLVAGADVVVSLYLLVLAGFLWLRPPEPARMNLVGLSIALTLGFTDMVAMAARQMVPGFPATSFILLGLGFVVLSWRYLIVGEAVLMAAWLISTQLFATNPWEAWFIIQISLIAGIGIHWGRLHSVTALLTANRNEAIARQRVEILNQDLEGFTGMVAHDLQNPLSAIRLKASLLRLRVEDQAYDVKRIVDEIDHVAKGMTTMVGSLLGYAKAGQEIQRESVDLEHVMRTVVEIFEERMTAEGGALVVADMPRVVGDETLLVQLMQNLIGNALNYRREDEPPRINVMALPENGGTLLSVSDNGVGIAGEDVDRLFEPFERGDVDAPGHGLGLATCRRIAEAHGGWIRAAKKPEGATFEVWLPSVLDAERKSAMQVSKVKG